MRYLVNVTVELETQSQGDAVTEVERRLKSGWKLFPFGEPTSPQYDRADISVLEAHVKVAKKS